MSRKERLFSVVMGGSVKEGGKTYHRYTIMGPHGEAMRGARAGTKAQVRSQAQVFADKLEACAPGEFRIVKRAA